MCMQGWMVFQSPQRKLLFPQFRVPRMGNRIDCYRCPNQRASSACVCLQITFLTCKNYDTLLSNEHNLLSVNHEFVNTLSLYLPSHLSIYFIYFIRQRTFVDRMCIKIKKGIIAYNIYIYSDTAIFGWNNQSISKLFIPGLKHRCTISYQRVKCCNIIISLIFSSVTGSLSITR